MGLRWWAPNGESSVWRDFVGFSEGDPGAACNIHATALEGLTVSDVPAQVRGRSRRT